MDVLLAIANQLLDCLMLTLEEIRRQLAIADAGEKYARLVLAITKVEAIKSLLTFDHLEGDTNADE